MFGNFAQKMYNNSMIEKEKILKTIDNVENFLFKAHSCMFCDCECADDDFRICFRCKKNLDFIGDRYCLKCGAKLSDDYEFCIECKSKQHEFDKARSVLVYNEKSSPAILKFKYGGRKAFALPLARILAKRFETVDIIADVVTFVPMPKEREKERGYNQSFELCKEFSSLTGILMIDALERVKNVERQATLGRAERIKNMQGSFNAKNKQEFKNKDVLLIDDVVTTGATASECAKTLLNAGAKSVSVLSIAKTPTLGSWKMHKVTQKNKEKCWSFLFAFTFDIIYYILLYGDTYMGLFSYFANFDNNRSLKKLEKIASKVEELDNKYASMTDDELKAQTEILKERLKNGETLDDILPDAFAVVREASFRVLKMKHFHVQIIGGIVLHQGRIAEMKTGEGKTLVSTLPAYLNALSGKPVHIVTVNEYLAKRDAEWMGKIHRFLGLKVGVVYSNQDLKEKKEAYDADITYGTNSEFGFDYLRDNMALSREQMMMRGLEFAIIDEVDSILIDEARTPLILSGPAGDTCENYETACRFAKTLKKDDVLIDEKKKTIHLTEAGVAKAERFYHIENLSDVSNTDINHDINNAIRARFMMKKDNDYIVVNGEVLIVDEFTGRVMIGRRYSDGLHQAIEAKEGVKINAENKTLATVTLQNFFKMYSKISGMTGTAKTEEAEFRDIYGLDVVTIPTNSPVQRIDKPDSFYFSHDAKIRAICADIQDCYERKQPVLVGTITVEKSEELSKQLRKLKIPHNVLNAKNHEREAEIVAQAGRLGAVTIATNMAGRGTDITLGGNAEFKAKQEMRKLGYDEELIELASSYFAVDKEEEKQARNTFQNLLEKYGKEVKSEKEQVKELGGLKIIGTERHESRRIDNQLRGRSGRQGDPGISIFYISADDDLARVFGSDRLKRMAEMLKLDEDTSINWKFFSRSVETAQKRVEARNFSIRKQVVEYDNVLNRQREEVYKERNRILDGEDVHGKILEMIREVVNNAVLEYDNDKQPDEVDKEAFNAELENRLLEKGTAFITDEVLNRYSTRELAEEIYSLAVARYEKKKEETEADGIEFGRVERDILLRCMDKKWIDHIDDMDILRQGVGLRAYGNKNPITVYQQEGYDMFENMIASMRMDAANIMMGIKIINGAKQPPKKNPAQNLRPQGTVVNKNKTVGRNDPCPCGSGKKYKNCCGR